MDYNAEFQKKLDQLNDEQHAAVEQIDGPVMVVAGPGTGKTQLLAMRVANILRQTDVLPSNILCLTFTEAAATNMTERLSTIIGADAYKVTISTFHGFGSSVISRYGEYFYHGASYQPADELTQGEIISDILSNLPFDNPLRAVNDGQFTYLRDIQKLIDNLKKAALTPDEISQIAQQNIEFCDKIAEHINSVFGERISAKLLPQYRRLVAIATDISLGQASLPFTTEPKLADVFAGELTTAIELAESGEKVSTKPISEFKKKWCKKEVVHGHQSTVLIDRERSQKIILAADVYAQYLEQMNQRQLYDFGDMIMNVVHAISQYPELKANLQEQYQYILVDEFQDTNDAQMRLLIELTDYDDQPNLMVVGDDDQAIYRFQGADVSNIRQFAARYGNHLTQINLSRNYRSGADILSASQAVATDISGRLTNLDGTPKQLIAARPVETTLRMVTASTIEQELDYVARSVKEQIDASTNPGDIAIIGRKHKSLELIAPYLAQYGVKVSYERQRNVYDSPLVQLLIELAELVQGMTTGNHSQINQHLPIVLASPAFGLSRSDYYRLSLAGGGDGTKWLNQLHASNQHRVLVDWLYEMARRAPIDPLNRIILDLVGTTATELSDNNDTDQADGDPSTTYRSPIFDYYFSADRLAENAYTYLSFLNDLTTLLNRLKEYAPDRQLKLADFLNYVQQCQNLSIAIYSTSSYGDQNNVQLLSAHGSKGLEFPTVYIIDAESEQWGSKSRSRSDMLPYPANMPYGTVAGSDDDERRRLLFVAMTRAKQNLIITSHTTNNQGKELNQLEYLLDFPNKEQLPEPDMVTSIHQIETSLMEHIAEPPLDQLEVLAPRLAQYKLSATALNTFTDVINGGPQYFLLYSLLRVPSGTSGALALGNAIHYTMQQLHNVVRLGHPLPSINQALAIFHESFDRQARDLPATDARTYRDKGDHALTIYLERRGANFTASQLAEQQLNATIDGDIRLTGKLDCLDIDQQAHTIRIIDYKTGKGIDDFAAHGSSYDKAKARRYKQQLMFYKILVEESGDYPGYQVTDGQLEFVEPDRHGQLYSPTLLYDADELAEFRRLIRSVWNHIIRLDLPDISDYSQDYKGIVAFEDWLIQNP